MTPQSLYRRPPPPPCGTHIRPPPHSSSLLCIHRVSLGFTSSTTITTSLSAAVAGAQPTSQPPLASVLRFLDDKKKKRIDDGDDVTLDLLLDALSPKEQTVVLKSHRNDWRRVLHLFCRMRLRPSYSPNPIHYNIVLRSLGRARRWDDLRRLFSSLSREITPTNQTYAVLIDVFDRAGLSPRESLLWLHHMRIYAGLSPDEVTAGTVLRVLRDSRQFEAARMFFRQWRDGKTEFDLTKHELNKSEDSNPASPAHFLLTELFRVSSRNSSRRIPPDEGPRIPKRAATYNTIIDLYGKAGWLEDASNAFLEMINFGVEPDTTTFNTMIHVCGSHGHMEEAEALFCKMEERGVHPDPKSFNVLMSLYSLECDVDKVLMCYRKIREVGLRPDVVTHRIVLQVLCKNKMVREVEEVIGKIVELGDTVDEQSMPVIMKLYVDEGLLNKAGIFFEKYCGNGEICSKIYAAIIDAYAEKGLWKEAEDVFFVKRDITRGKDVMEYNVMIKAYGKAKLYDKALSLFEGMRSCGNWPDECTFTSLIEMLSSGDLPERSREFLGKMVEAGFKPRCETFSAVIACYCRNGRMPDAIEVYQEMKNYNVKPNEVVFGSIIDGFVECGQIENALHYFRVMEDVGLSANIIILTSLIKGYTKISCWKESQELYTQIKNMEAGSDVIASNCMLNLYARLGMVSEAKSLFDELRRIGQADGVSYTTMMYLYKNMGMLPEATDMAQEMQQSGLLNDCASYNNVFASYVVNGKLRECGDLLHQMIARKLLPDDSTFKLLFTLLKKGGFSPEAVSQLESSYGEGKPFARQAIFTSVFSLLELYSFALESCRTFLTAGIALDSSAYNVAIYAYGAVGDADKALNLFMRMQDEGFQPDLVTYINLATCYGKAGMVEGLKRIYGLMKHGDIDPNESLFRALIEAYKVAGRHDLAELVDQEMKFSINNVEENEESRYDGGF